MKIFRKEGHVYVENGRSKIRVRSMGHALDPIGHPGKVIAFYHVQKIVKDSAFNNGNLRVGNAIALAIPKEYADSPSYTWPKGVQAQVNMTLDTGDPKN